MSGVKLQKFLGRAPRIAPELLPDMAAQVATNVKLYSGDLIPYSIPSVIGNHGQVTPEVQTLHALYSPTTGEPVWLAWAADVDVATPAGDESTTEQRFYYTGDGKPKVSTYAMATSGAAPYPTTAYELGLPLPTVTPTAVADSFTTKTSASYARDAGGVVTLTTAAAHGLKTGAYATISGFTDVTGTYAQSGTTITVTITAHGLAIGSDVLLRFTSGAAVDNIFTVEATPTADTFTVTASTSATTSGDVDWDISDFNAQSIEVTAVDSTTLSYFSPGFQVTTTSSSDGRVDIAGNTQARSYLYTWFTPWEEESIGSEPSEALFIKEGQVVTVSDLPTTKPTGGNNIAGVRLYRTLSSSSDTEYLRLATLWFPVTVTSVTSGTVVTAQEHNLTVGAFFKISTGVSGGEVTDIIDDYTFTYTGGTGSGGDGGTLYHDVSEVPGVDTPRYWGDGGDYDFVDDFSATSLLNALVTDNYEPPPADLAGLVVYNNILVGFVGNELYFSEVGQFHAWPLAYKLQVPHNIVAVTVFAGRLFVATDSYPYLVDGNTPGVMSLTRIDAPYPCLSKRSVVNMGYGVMYSTNDGLALYSTSTGAALATRLIQHADTWDGELDASTIIGAAYKDAYLGWHSTGGFSFEREDTIGGFFVDLVADPQPIATWFDPRTNSLYYAAGALGDVYLWEAPTQPPRVFEWKSKVILTPNPINIGAAQIHADYVAVSPLWEANTTLWEAQDTSWENDGGVTFKLWANDDLLFTHVADSARAFRLPAGYMADRFEVSVSGSVRLRSIRLSETPYGLREL